MPPKAFIIGMHIVGLPASILTFLNITFDTWQGWIMLILSAVYLLSNLFFVIAKGIINLRNAIFDLNVKKGKYVLRNQQTKKK